MTLVALASLPLLICAAILGFAWWEVVRDERDREPDTFVPEEWS